ncbi:MAG: hypothetical protein FGM52_01775 [Mycobacterium sp.]|nr:hypothetical protein [Mycobacterium sp.]
MGTVGRLAGWIAALATVLCGCTLGGAPPPTEPESSPVPGSPVPAAAPEPPTRGEAVRQWEAVAREHFKESAAALQEVAEASDREDEAGLRVGCQRLHDTNSVGLQQDLPTPDPQLTAELQRMVDDMNVATHACLRFALGRNPVDADTYQMYLTRAVEHLRRAKTILTAAG